MSTLSITLNKKLYMSIIIAAAHFLYSYYWFCVISKAAKDVVPIRFI